MNNTPLTMTKWNTTFNSSVLDSGLALSFFEMNYDDDQGKIDQIVDDSNFKYFHNICFNMGFSISKHNPNILVYDVNSPAGSSIRNSYGLYDLTSLFDNRYDKTYTLDNNILYINIYLYNR